MHGADDFLLMFVSIGLFSEPFETEYTTEGEDAMATIVLYLVVIAAYLPFTIKSLREIRGRGYVWRGAFMDRDVALMRERERKEQERARMQAQATLWAQGPVRPQAVPLAQVTQYPGQMPAYAAPYGQTPVQPQMAPYGQTPPNPARPQAVPLAQVPRRDDDFGSRPPAPKGLA